MRYIKKLVDELDKELHSAKDYAEKYVEYKAADGGEMATKFKTMANDELSHAYTIHEIAVNKIAALRKYYTPTEDMQDKWERSHAAYIEKTNWIKQMLSL